MSENPALELALYNAVREFIKTESAEVWAIKVAPLLEKMVAQNLVKSGTIAVSNTGLVVAGELMTEAEVIAAEAAGSTALPGILRRVGIRAAGSIRPLPPLVIAVVVGVSVLSTTREVMAATNQLNPENQMAYKNYLNKYLGYMIKQIEKGKTLREFPPPKLYKEWLDRDTNRAWWE